MQVEGVIHRDGNLSIEIGWSTWADGADRVVRNRYDNGGRFSRSGSSEVSLLDLKQLVIKAAEAGEFGLGDLGEMITALGKEVDPKTPLIRGDIVADESEFDALRRRIREA